MAGLPKKVVFRKPKIKQPINTNNYANATDQPPTPPQESSKQDLEEDLNIPEKEEPQKIIHTESKRAIIVKMEPKKPVDLPTPRKIQTFDDKVMNRINITSNINKDEKTLNKIKKQEIPSTRKSKEKVKMKLTLRTIISLILSMIMIVWTFKVITDYMSNMMDGSLASFVYVIAMVMFTIMLFIWFIIELIKGDKNK